MSEGLEGRSSNPVALLYDALMHPRADVGEHHPPSLSWQKHPSRAISHVVLGSGLPGGSWHDMQPEIQTLSLGSWLELPAYRFQDWLDDQEKSGFPSRHKSTGRISFSKVARYYVDYVSKMGLESAFLNGVTVTGVVANERILQRNDRSASLSSESTSECSLEQSRPNTPCESSSSNLENSKPEKFSFPSCSENNHLIVPPTSPMSVASPTSEETLYSCVSDSEDSVICCGAAKKQKLCPGYKWFIRGTELDSKTGKERKVAICAKNIVLACGVNGNPVQLNVPGEDTPFITHRFSEFVANLQTIQEESNISPSVLVVGAGLTAADAILHALSRGVKVYHSFYQDPNDSKLVYNKMPPSLYQEYCHIADLMRGRIKSELYIPLAKHRISEFRPGNVFVAINEEGAQTQFNVSLAAVLIGSQASLDFLPNQISSKLGVNSDEFIHAKRNPIDTHSFSFQSESVSSLYAMGPLVGDNFVRFILGGALGITQNLLNQ